MVRRAEGALLQSIAIDRASTRSLSAQICAGLRDLILGGSLKAGERLPASRTLAGEFGVARTTIVDSFDQLIAEGLLETRVGAGTFVSPALDAERPARPAAAIPAPSAAARLSRSMTQAAEEFVDRLGHEQRPFTTAMPALDAFPMAQWSRLSAKHWRRPRQEALGYPDLQGHAPLRQAIAAHLRANRGIDCDWRQIFIVAGAQQAFHLVANALVDPGDKVWFENPGAIGARNSLVLSGADLTPIPVDDAGLDVARGLELAPQFKLAFVTPAHQQPLGAKLSLERRFALLKAAEDCQGWIIEDDWDGEFCFSGRPLPTLKSIDDPGRVIYVGTFSKSLFPSLRLGFLLAPPALRQPIRIGLESFSPGVPTASQAILADFIAEGHFATHVRRMRKLYAERHQALIDAAESHLAEWLEMTPTTTGMHCAAFLRPGLDAEAISAAAANKGLTVVPISRFCLTPIDRQGLVLGFSGFSPSQIEAGAKRLREVLSGMTRRMAAE